MTYGASISVYFHQTAQTTKNAFTYMLCGHAMASLHWMAPMLRVRPEHPTVEKTKMPEIKTIVDDNGDVWTGKVTGTDDHLARDIIGGIIFPLSVLVPSDPPTVTMEVNGQSHSGTEHKK